MAVRLIAILAALVCVAAAETAVPPIWPQLQGIFPNGARRGAEVKISLKGRNLQDSREILFRSPKLRGRVLKATAYQVDALVSVSPDAEPGRHDLRLVAPHGSALGYMDVTTLPERTEKEPNENMAQAEPLTFPIVVNGIIRQADYDYFRFKATTGQTLVFDVLATRNGANTDAVLSILEEAGEELAYSDDYYGFKDPHITYLFAKDGTYYARVYGSSEAGSDTSSYRLIAGDMLAGAEVTSATPTEARVRLTVPAGTPPGDYKLHASGAALPVPFVVSSYSEISVADGRARRRDDPVPVALPVVVNGVIDKPHAADYFIFRVEQPKTVVLDANSMQLGFLTDPLVAIYDEAGKRLANRDDPTTNTGKEPANMDPHLVYRIEKPGRYIAMVRDAQLRGDHSLLKLVDSKIRFWDHHSTIFPSYANEFMPELDQAFTGLLTDLDQRGMLDSTLVLVTGEFGRTAEINVNNGRDRWLNCFSLVLAGAGVPKGQIVGASDADGMYVKDHPVEVPDLEKEYVSNISRPIQIAEGRPLNFLG